MELIYTRLKFEIKLKNIAIYILFKKDTPQEDETIICVQVNLKFSKIDQ